MEKLALAIERYKGMRADVLVTHEAPDLHPHGNQALTRLANNLRVLAGFHGHHHENRTYLDSPWHGVALFGILALDTKTFGVTQIDYGVVSNKDLKNRSNQQVNQA